MAITRSIWAAMKKAAQPAAPLSKDTPTKETAKTSRAVPKRNKQASAAPERALEKSLTRSPGANEKPPFASSKTVTEPSTAGPKNSNGNATPMASRPTPAPSTAHFPRIRPGTPTDTSTEATFDERVIGLDQDATNNTDANQQAVETYSQELQLLGQENDHQRLIDSVGLGNNFTETFLDGDQQWEASIQPVDHVSNTVTHAKHHNERIEAPASFLGDILHDPKSSKEPGFQLANQLFAPPSTVQPASMVPYTYQNHDYVDAAPENPSSPASLGPAQDPLPSSPAVTEPIVPEFHVYLRGLIVDRNDIFGQLPAMNRISTPEQPIKDKLGPTNMIGANTTHDQSQGASEIASAPRWIGKVHSIPTGPEHRTQQPPNGFPLPVCPPALGLPSAYDNDTVTLPMMHMMGDMETEAFGRGFSSEDGERLHDIAEGRAHSQSVAQQRSDMLRANMLRANRQQARQQPVPRQDIPPAAAPLVQTAPAAVPVQNPSPVDSQSWLDEDREPYPDGFLAWTEVAQANGTTPGYEDDTAPAAMPTTIPSPAFATMAARAVVAGNDAEADAMDDAVSNAEIDSEAETEINDFSIAADTFIAMFHPDHHSMGDLQLSDTQSADTSLQQTLFGPHGPTEHGSSHLKRVRALSNQSDDDARPVRKEGRRGENDRKLV